MTNTRSAKETTAGTTEKYRAPALERGLDIIELLVTQSEPMSLQEIGQALGKSKGELFRMMNVLERRKYVSRHNSNDRYSLTNKLFSLALEQTPVRELVTVAMPIMHTLSDTIDQTCHLAVPSEDQIVVIARAEAPGATTFTVRLGYHQFSPNTVSGRLLFACQSDDTKEKWLDLFRQDDRFNDEAGFLARVEAIRGAGYEKSPSAYVKGVTDIAAPITNFDVAQAALTVPFIDKTTSSVTVDDAVTALVSAAQEISNRLMFGEDQG